MTLRAPLQCCLSEPALVFFLVVGTILSAFSVSWVTAAETDSEGPALIVRVTGGDGGPILQGEVQLTGTTDKNKYFRQTAGIRRGKATLYLDRGRVKDMTVKISAPAHMSHYKKFVPNKEDESFAVEPEYQFQLKSGIKIGGRVVDKADKPIEGAELHAYVPTNQEIQEGFDTFESQVTTNAEGRWELDGAPADLSKLVLRVRDKSHVSSPEVDTVRPEDHAKLKQLADIRRLADAPRFACTVVDPAGRPVEGAMLLVSGGDHYRQYNRGEIPLTDAKGEVQLPKVSVGVLEFTLFHRDWARGGERPRIPQTSPLTIPMRKGKQVKFLCVDTEGKPISDVAFYPQAPRGPEPQPDREIVFLRALDFLSHRNLLNNRTDENGEFVWEHAPDIKLGYQIISKDYLSQPGGDYGPEGSPHKLVFRRTIPVHARIVEAVGGDPIKDFKVVYGMHFKRNPPGMWTWSERKADVLPGEFHGELDTLDRVMRFRVEAKGYRSMVSRELDAAALPDTPVALEFRMVRDTEYAAQVLRPDGRPAAGARIDVSVFKDAGSYKALSITNGVVDESTATATVTADGDGKLKLPPLGETFISFVSHESGYRQLMDAELFAEPAIKLLPWAKVEGQLFVQGRPAANTAVSLHGLETYFGFDTELPVIQIRNGLRTDAAGKFEFSKVTADRWTRTITYDEQLVEGNRSYQQREYFTLSPGQTRSEVIGRQGADVVGRVKWPNDPKIVYEGNYVSGQEFAQPPPDEPRDRIKSQHLLRLPKDGAFRCLNFAPGRHEITITLRVKAEDFPKPAYSKTITITPEMFAGKSPTNPIDLGEIEVEPIE